MKKKTIAFSDLSKREKELYKKVFPDSKFYRSKQIGRRTDKDIKILSVSVHTLLSRRVLEKFPNLKFIATRSTGYDHIDINYCKSAGIYVSNVPLYGDCTIAEHAFAMLLALAKKLYLPQLETLHKKGREALTGIDLHNKTIGIIGAGNIGKHAIRIASGFGMRIKVFDIHQDKMLSEVLGYSYVSMDELLKTSDIISLHVPLNKHTYHLINNEAIKKMKKGVIIINTARGEVIDTEALYKGLLARKISGAALDVIEEESKLIEQKGAKVSRTIKKLLEHKNVLYTPHNAYNTSEALYRIFETTCENINAFMKGSPINVVF